MEKVDNLPDVDLSSIADSLDKETKDKEKDTKEKVEQDLAQFKSPEALLKSYKELQGAFTKKSQDNKDLENRIKELQDQINLSAGTVNQTAHIETDDQFWNNPQAVIQNTILENRVIEVLEEIQEESESIADFQERYAYAQRVVQQYPNLGKSVGGIKKAFKYGDKLRAEAIKQNSSKLLETLFGEPLEPEDLNRLKEMVKGKKTNKKSNAYMPDTNTTTTATSELNQDPSKDGISEAAKKGDVDGVLNNMFKSLMAE